MRLKYEFYLRKESDFLKKAQFHFGIAMFYPM